MKLKSSCSSLFWLLLGVGGVTFAVFSGTLGHDFVNWDDPFYVTGNREIAGLDREHLRLMFTTFQYGFYAPLSQLSLAVDHALWGLEPFGYHLSSVFLHAVNAALAGWLILRLLRMAGPAGKDGGERNCADFFAAGFGALLYALHPLRAESVAWVSERRDVLSGALALLSVLSYLEYAEAGTGRAKGRRWYLGAFVLFVLALLAKPSVVTVPFVLMLLDVHPLRRWEGISWHGAMRLLGEKVPMIVLSLASGLGAVYGVGCGDLDNTAYDLQVLDVGSRLAQMFAANLHYLQTMFWPANLNPLYAFKHLYHFNEPVVWLAMGAAFGVTAAAWVWRPGAMVCWLAYLFMVGPFLGLAASGPQFAADRYTYLAAIPWSAIAAWVMSWGWKKSVSQPGWRKAWIGLAVVLTMALGIMTWRQNAIWRDSVRLWTHSTKVDPDGFFAWKNLGDAFCEEKRPREALAAYGQALRLNPQAAGVWFNMANALSELGEHGEAIKLYRRVLAADPHDAGALNNLARALVKQESFREALPLFLKAAKLIPSPALTFNAGICHEGLGDETEALKCYEAAAQGGYAEAWVSWAEIVARRQGSAAAVRLLETAMERNDHLRLRAAYADMFLRQPRLSSKELKEMEAFLRALDEKMKGRSRRVAELLEKCRNKRGL
ncbi:MAG: tetratricopeptide repeat protein [Verrucomicrobiae bacterium]|nr:tetratricopeptide repeat protein [Verrucomicrobiae bacterium]